MIRTLPIALALIGCGGEGLAPSTVNLADGTPDIPWAAAEDPQVQAPDISWLAEGRPPIAPPNFGGCREGWVPTDRDGVSVCEPWPEGRQTCAGATAQFPGDSACAEVDAGCPAGDFADGLSGEVRYVAPEATAGDGTIDAPFGTIAEAIEALPVEGGTVALAKGDHVGGLVVDRPVSLVGACAAQTQIVGPTCSKPRQAIVSATADLTLESLQITGDTCPGIYATAALSLSGVVVHDVASPGIMSEGLADLTRVALRDVGTGAPDTGEAGVGLWNVSSAMTTIKVSVERTTGTAVRMGIAGRLIAEDLAIVDVSPGPESGFQAGLSGSPFYSSISGLVIENVEYNAATLGWDGLMEDVVIRADADAPPVQQGLTVRSSAWPPARRLWIQADGGAVRFSDVAATVQDSLIEGPAEEFGYAVGISTDGAAPLTLERVVARGFGEAVFIEHDLMALDVVLSGDTAISSFLNDDANIAVYRGDLRAADWYQVLQTSAGFGGLNNDTVVTLSNVRARGGSAGLYASTYVLEHTLFEIEGSPFFGGQYSDLTITDSVFRAAGDEYTVLLDANAGTLTAERVAFEGGDSFAVEWWDGNATLTDLTLSNRLGGISASAGAVELTRAQMEGIGGVGIAVGREGSATIRDVFITDTTVGEDPERPAIGLYVAGRLLAERVLAQGTEGYSVVVDGGQATLNDVSGPDGIVVQRQGLVAGARVNGELTVDPEAPIPAAWGL